MQKWIAGLVLVAALALAFMFLFPAQENPVAPCKANPSQSEIMLPRPDYSGMALEDAIGKRRSVRKFGNESLSLSELSQLLWAGQGITGEGGLRAAPSAGGLYPMTLYVVPNNVEGVGCGIYRYVPGENKLMLHKEGDFSQELYEAALLQEPARSAGAVIVFGANESRTSSKYQQNAERFVAIEAGHISENILLEAVSLGLGAVPIGGIDQKKMDALLGLQGTGQSVVYLNAVGK